MFIMNFKYAMITLQIRVYNIEERNFGMGKEIKWSKYIWLSLLIFSAFLLEYFALFIIEMLIFKMDIWNYTANQRSIHHLIMVGIWILYIGSILFYAKRKSLFPNKELPFKLSTKNYLIAILCLVGCKVMTFIDWQTLKVIGEANGKDMFQFTTQYMYYILEVVIVLLIIVFGQKAFELRIGKESNIPFGGIVLAFTWGIFHFVSRGVGIEIWNGISCVIFSLLSGLMYLNLDRSIKLSYVFIAIGYLL